MIIDDSSRDQSFQIAKELEKNVEAFQLSRYYNNIIKSRSAGTLQQASPGKRQNPEEAIKMFKGLKSSRTHMGWCWQSGLIGRVHQDRRRF